MTTTTKEAASLDITAAISAEDIRQYEESGVVCLRGLFDTAWLECLERATQKSMDQGGFEMAPDGDGRFHSNLFMWTHDPDFRDFVFHSPAALIAKTLMRSSQVRFYFDHLFVKEPGSSTKTPWHHDQPYWPVRGEQVASIWVTLDHVTLKTGGLQYVKGSHRWGKRFNPAAFGEDRTGMIATLQDDDNFEIPDIDADRNQYDLLSWDMAPGDCLVHHSLAVHGADGNASTATRRRALSTRWLGDDAVYWPLPKVKQQGGLAVEGFVRGQSMMDGGDPVFQQRFPAMAV